MCFQSRDVSPCQEGGCPFKHFDPEHLQAKLKSENISDGGREDILMLCMVGEYSSACWKYLMLRIKQSFHESARMKSVLESADVQHHSQKECCESDSSHSEQCSKCDMNCAKTCDAKSYSENAAVHLLANSNTVLLGRVTKKSRKRLQPISLDTDHRCIDDRGHIDHRCEGSVQSEQSYNIGKPCTCGHFQPLQVENSTVMSSSKSFDDSNNSRDSCKKGTESLKELNYSCIHKPLDYYRTYNQLLNGLKS